MKIAMIGQKGIPAKWGGIEKHVESLSSNLVRLGHFVTVFTRAYYTPSSLKNYKGVKLISLPSFKTKHLDAISHTFLATLHALFQDYDIIHYHGVGPALLSFIPRLLKPKTKVVVTFHCIDRKHQKWGKLARFVLKLGEKAALNFPHLTISVSNTLYRYCLNQYHKKTLLIPNGVNIPSTVPKKTFLSRFNLVKNQYILTVSRLIPHKGIHFLIKAFRGLRTPFKLVIVGKPFYTQDYYRKLKKIAGSDKRIIFTGSLSGKILESLYAYCFLFVLPSEHEGLSLSLLEAASYGKPILASDIPENKEIILGNKYFGRIGFLFKSGDVKDLKEKLKRLLKAGKTLKLFGLRAQKFVNMYYGWDKIAKSTEKEYKNLLKGKETSFFTFSFKRIIPFL